MAKSRAKGKTEPLTTLKTLNPSLFFLTPEAPYTNNQGTLTYYKETIHDCTST
jgi:hypothetical protein